MKAFIIPGAFAICVSLAGVAGFTGGKATKQGQWDAAVVAETKGKDAALKAAAEAIAKIEVTSETHIQPVRTEIRTNTVYRDCKHSPDSLRHINSLITGTESPGSGGLSQAK